MKIRHIHINPSTVNSEQSDGLHINKKAKSHTWCL